jgi:hypothetical protein
VLDYCIYSTPLPKNNIIQLKHSLGCCWHYELKLFCLMIRVWNGGSILWLIILSDSGSPPFLSMLIYRLLRLSWAILQELETGLGRWVQQWQSPRSPPFLWRWLWYRRLLVVFFFMMSVCKHSSTEQCKAVHIIQEEHSVNLMIQMRCPCAGADTDLDFCVHRAQVSNAHLAHLSDNPSVCTELSEMTREHCNSLFILKTASGWGKR